MSAPTLHPTRSLLVGLCLFLLPAAEAAAWGLRHDAGG